jgi:polar amino acid transport system substrate-binding protein
MKKAISIALVAVVLTSAVFVGCKKDAPGLTKKPGVLSVGVEIGYPPFEYYDDNGKPAGFDVQMANAIGAKLGLKVVFVDTAWDGIFAGVIKGDYDCIISAVTITEARKGVHNFSKPYIGNAQALVLRKGSPVTARNPTELAGLGVAYQEETTSDIYMTGLANDGLQFTPYEYAKIFNCFDDLKLGRVDAIICDNTVAVDYIAPADSPFEIVWQGDADEYFAICFNKGNDALTEAIDKALDELFADGTMAKMSNDIFHMDLVSAARK